MSSTRVLSSSFIALVVCSVGFASPALGQETDASANSDRQDQVSATRDIIVTATRELASLRDVPMTVNVMTGESLEKLKAFDIKEISQLTPGLLLTDNGGSDKSVTLRGISFNPRSSGDPAVEIYMNELSLYGESAFTALYDIQQIEVLRGPQGTLRGRVTPAGAITITTRKPDLDTPNGFVQGTLTDQDASNLQAAVSLPVVTDKLAVRVAGLVDRNDANQVTNIATGNSSRSKTESARASLLWEPSSDFSVWLTYQYLQNRDVTERQVFGLGNLPTVTDPTLSGPPLGPLDRAAVAEGLPERRKYKTDFLSLVSNFRLLEHNVTLVAGYQNNRYTTPYFDNDFGNAIPNYIRDYSVEAALKTTTLDLQIASDTDRFLSYTIGGFYYHRDIYAGIDSDISSFFSSGGIPLSPSTGAIYPLRAFSNVDAQEDIYALTGTSTLQFTDDLKLVAGLRYSDMKLYQQIYLTVTVPGNPPTVLLADSQLVAPESATRRSHPLTGSASLTYNFSADVTGYVAYSRATRRGSNIVGVTAPLSDDLLVVPSERTDSVEAGLKASLFDNRLRLNAAVYYQDFKNYQGRVPYNVFYASGRNGVIDGNSGFPLVAPAKVKGAELEIAADPLPGWSFVLNLNYSDAKYSGGQSPCNDFNGDGVPDASGTPTVPLGQQVSYCSAKGVRLSDLPAFSLNTSSEYTVTVGKFDLFARALLNYRPSVISDLIQRRYRSRTDINLFAGVRSGDESWELSGFVKNLLNQQRITYSEIGNFVIATSDLGTGLPGVPFDSGYRQTSVSTPREFGVSLRFSF